jgi:hypothetical protein
MLTFLFLSICFYYLQQFLCCCPFFPMCLCVYSFVVARQRLDKHVRAVIHTQK